MQKSGQYGEIFLLSYPAHCCSVTQSCLTLCDSMDCSTPGLPVPRHLPSLPKFMFTASVMLSSHLIPWCPLLFLPSIFPRASGTFSMSHLFASDDQNTRASSSASVLPVNIQGWSSLRLTGLISLQSKGLSGVFSSITIQRHQFFDILLS